MMNIWSLNGARFTGPSPDEEPGTIRWLRSLAHPGAVVPDVLCLQDFRVSLAALLRPLPYFTFVPMTNHWFWGKRESLGIAVASKYPLTEIDVHHTWGDGVVRDLEGVDRNNHRIKPDALSDELVMKTENRVAVACTVNRPDSGERFRVATHHGFWTRNGVPTDEQMSSTRSVAHFLAGQARQHGGLVYLADYNPDREGRAHALYLASGARDWLPAETATTLAHDHPAAQLGIKSDCIMTWPDRDGHPRYCVDNVFLDPTPQSDHLMLRCQAWRGQEC